MKVYVLNRSLYPFEDESFQTIKVFEKREDALDELKDFDEEWPDEFYVKEFELQTERDTMNKKYVLFIGNEFPTDGRFCDHKPYCICDTKEQAEQLAGLIDVNGTYLITELPYLKQA